MCSVGAGAIRRFLKPAMNDSGTSKPSSGTDLDGTRFGRVARSIDRVVRILFLFFVACLVMGAIGYEAPRLVHNGLAMVCVACTWWLLVRSLLPVSKWNLIMALLYIVLCVIWGMASF